MNVVVIGGGYVGCVSAACLARLGHQVIVMDTDEHKVEQIQAGRSPVLEPGLDELLAEQVRAGRLSASAQAPRLPCRRSALPDEDAGFVGMGISCTACSHRS